VCWGTGLLDLDNDGNPDIFIVTGQVYPELEAVNPKYPRKGPRILFRNQGNGTFQQITDEAGPALDARHVSRGCAFGDFDNDGDLDVVIMNQNEAPTLLRNDAPPGNHWIKIRVQGTKSNRSAIGSRIVLRYGGKTQVQELMSQSSYVSSNDPRLHFGLGSFDPSTSRFAGPWEISRFTRTSAPINSSLCGRDPVPSRQNVSSPHRPRPAGRTDLPNRKQVQGWRREFSQRAELQAIPLDVLCQVIPALQAMAW
jgi:hypothetical protein